MERLNNYYSDHFKLGVIREVLEGGLSKESARRKYGIKGKSAILKWMRKFGLLNQNDLHNIMDQNKEQESLSEPAALEKRIKELERALEDARLQAEVYSRMIDIAEQELHIRIRKKPFAKQSGK